jgi:hypothetical protein
MATSSTAPERIQTVAGHTIRASRSAAVVLFAVWRTSGLGTTQGVPQHGVFNPPLPVKMQV